MSMPESLRSDPNASPDSSFGRLRFSLFLLMAAGVAAAAIVAGCSSGPTTAQRDQELLDKLQAKSKYDLTRNYTQNFEQEDALKDFSWRPGSKDPLEYLGTTKAQIGGGRLLVEGSSLEWQDEATTWTSYSVPRGIAWLDKPLPHTVEIELTVEALKEPQDLNFFLGGDKKHPSGYEVVLGGQQNTKNGIYIWQEGALRPEVDFGRVKLGGSYDMLPLTKNRRYDVRIVRDGREITVELDGTMVMRESDEKELELEDTSLHQIAPFIDDEFRYFGISTWGNEIAVDDLRIREIKPQIDAAPAK